MNKMKQKRVLTLGLVLLIGIGMIGSVTTDISSTPFDNIFNDLFGEINNFWTIDSASSATSDTSDGSFLLNAAPNVADVNFVDSTYTLTSTLTPDDSTIFGVNFTVTSAATLTDILNCTIYVFDDSTHGADYTTADPDGILLTRFVWTEADDTWAIDQDTMTQWTMQSPVDPGTASAETTYEFCCRFDISKVARAEASDWNASVHVFDDDGTPETDSASEAGLVTMATNFDVSFSAGTFSFGTVEPATTNNTITAGLTITIYANAQWELRISGSDFTASAETPIDLDATDCVAWDHDNSNGGDSFWIRNTATTGMDTWDNQAAMSTEAGFSRNVYVFLSTSNFFDAGVGKTWTFTYTILIQANV